MRRGGLVLLMLAGALQAAGFRAGVRVRLEQPLRASRPALVYRRLNPDEEPTFPYLGTAEPPALVPMPPDTPEADLPLERGKLAGDELRVVVVGEALAEGLSRALWENCIFGV